MKIKLLAITIFFNGVFLAYGQTFDYAWHTSGPMANATTSSPYASSNKIAGDTLYVLYEFNGDSIDANPFVGEDWIFDEDMSSYSNVFFITKYSLNGQYISSMKLVETGGGGYFNLVDFEIAENGSIILIGSIYYNPIPTDFDPSTNTAPAYSVSAPGQTAGTIAFYNFNGGYLGHIEYLIAGPWPNYTEGFYPSDAVLDNNNQLYIIGSFYGTTDFDFTAAVDSQTSNGELDIAVMKIDLTNQSYVWTKVFGSAYNDYGIFIEYENGAIYLAGNFKETMDMDPGAGVANEVYAYTGYDGIFLTKLDVNGSYLNSFSFAALAHDTEIYDLGVDAQNNVYLSGSTPNTAVLDADPSVSTYFLSSANSYNNFLLKYDSDFELAWTKTFASDVNLYASYYNGLVVADSYIAFALSSYPGDISLIDNTSNTILMTPTGYEAIIVEVNKNDGSIMDTLRYKTDQPYSYGEIYSMVADNNQNLYALGQFEGLVDFNLSDNITIFDTTFQSSPPSYTDNAFNLRLDWLGFASDEELSSDNQFVLYPNPASSNFTIQSLNIISQIQIFDATGKIIFSQKNVEKNSLQIDLFNFETGIYFVQIVDVNNEMTTNKIIKN